MITELRSPPSWPFLGHLPALIRGGRPHRVLEDWCDRYGTTYRLRLPGGPAVVTADPAIVSTVLRGRPRLFRRDPRITRTIEATGIHGVFTAEGARWHADRRAANRLLIGDPQPVIDRAVDRLCRRWRALLADGQRVPVLADLTRLSLEVTVAATTGRDIGAIDNPDGPLQTLVPRLFPAIQRQLNTPFPLPRDRRLERLLRTARDLLPSDDFGTVLTLLLAGQDTTAAAAGWALHYLAGHPEELAAVRAETEPANYARAVVREALRLRPPASLTVVEAIEETWLTGEDGVRLRAVPSLPIWVLLTYGARRFPDAGVFQPSRWLTDRAPRDAVYLPFGGGPRVCPGRDLALLAAVAVVAAVTRNFDLRSDGPAREKVEFTVRPSRLPLVISAR
ncbi:cytochrome P450 [Actinoplanes subglobosus]|uniref:Cytochrome P450 n=1 Tax=Actinoplanes subglobosus TaxID=1547892 RepID=A0ABV8IVN9_9ACTN